MELEEEVHPGVKQGGSFEFSATASISVNNVHAHKVMSCECAGHGRVKRHEEV